VKLLKSSLAFLDYIPRYSSAPSVQAPKKAATLEALAVAHVYEIFGLYLRRFGIEPMLHHQLEHRSHACHRRAGHFRQLADQTLIGFFDLEKLKRSVYDP
jgi:hypothetical protein